MKEKNFLFIQLLDSFMSYWRDKKVMFKLACGRRIKVIAFICILKQDVLQNRVHKRLKIRPSVFNLKLKSS